MTLRASMRGLVAALGALVLGGVLVALWLGGQDASASGSAVSVAPSQIMVPGSSVALPPSLAERVDAATLRLGASDGHLHHFLAAGIEPGTVCLVSADDRRPMVAAVACDPTAVAAKKGIYLLESDAGGGASGGLLLPSGAVSARVNGSPGVVSNGVLALHLNPGQSAVEVQPEGAAAVTVPAP